MLYEEFMEKINMKTYRLYEELMFTGCMRSSYSNKLTDPEKSSLGTLKLTGHKVHRLTGRMKSSWI